MIYLLFSRFSFVNTITLNLDCFSQVAFALACPPDGKRKRSTRYLFKFCLSSVFACVGFRTVFTVIYGTKEFCEKEESLCERKNGAP